MKAKTEELLYLMLWAAETIQRPTFRNVTESFEGWAYRNGLHQQLSALEKSQLIERHGERPADRVHKLTEAGRLLALGGCDPMARWKRHWDGRWRMVLFDLPQKKASERVRLRRSLAQRGFGYLQNSVWITPDPLTDEREALADGPVEVESLILLEARPCAGESDLEIVKGAWNFDAIDHAYNRHDAVLTLLPRDPLTDTAGARRLHRWLREERLAWLEVAGLDPFLPVPLHPPGYGGMKAWRRRVECMSEAGRQMRTFQVAL
jgi:phenylacetic acid degradation operon negative regulatory protein